jgi:putative transcriptional regulator
MTNKQKRNLFEELKQGIREIKKHQTGKITLRTHKIEKKPHITITPKSILDTREQLHMSRAVFAIKLGVSIRTLEKWEQGKTMPNDQAITLILMVKQYPDTLERLEKIIY